MLPPIIQVTAELSPEGDQVQLKIVYGPHEDAPAFGVLVGIDTDGAAALGGQLLAKAGAVFAKPRSPLTLVHSALQNGNG